MFGQSIRPEEERNMAPWMRDALDQQRADALKNMRENPAIWQKLQELEAKLDRILVALAEISP